MRVLQRNWDVQTLDQPAIVHESFDGVPFKLPSGGDGDLWLPHRDWGISLMCMRSASLLLVPLVGSVC